jgi:hypothetical protein
VREREETHTHILIYIYIYAHLVTFLIKKTDQNFILPAWQLLGAAYCDLHVLCKFLHGKVVAGRSQGMQCGFSLAAPFLQRNLRNMKCICSIEMY